MNAESDARDVRIKEIREKVLDLVTLYGVNCLKIEINADLKKQDVRMNITEYNL
jgi:hypothetical protein